MQCEKFEDRLHELLDRREPPESDARLQEHAALCANCAEQLAAQESLFAGLKLSQPPELSANFTQRVMATSPPRRSNGAFGKLVVGLLVLAAILLIALLPAAWLIHFGAGPGGPGGEGPIAGREQPGGSSELLPGKQNGLATTDPGVPRGALPPDGEEGTGIAIASPDHRPSDQYDPDNERLPSLEDFAVVDPEQAERLRTVFVDRIATPLRPVTNSVNGAFNVLRRTLAAGGPDWPFDADDDDKPQADNSHPRGLQDLA